MPRNVTGSCGSLRRRCLRDSRQLHGARKIQCWTKVAFCDLGISTCHVVHGNAPSLTFTEGNQPRSIGMMCTTPIARRKSALITGRWCSQEWTHPRNRGVRCLHRRPLKSRRRSALRITSPECVQGVCNIPWNIPLRCCLLRRHRIRPRESPTPGFIARPVESTLLGQ